MNEADDGPRQIEVHDDGGVLEVLAFAQNVGGDHHAKLFGGRNVMGCLFVPRLIAVGAETAGVAGWFFGVAGDARHLLKPARLQLLRKVGDGVGKLGENKNLLSGMLFGQEFVEFGQLVILVWLPLAREFEDREKPLGVLPEMLGEVFDKDVGAQPIKIAGVLSPEQLVTESTGGGKISQRIGGD